MRSRLFALIVLLCTAAPSYAAAQGQGLPFEFSSVIFGNFQMRVDSQAKFTTGGKPSNRFDLGRAYLTFRFPLGEKASARLTTDIFQQANPASAAYYPGWSVRLKYGYLQYDATKNFAGVDGLAAAARIGMLQTVVVEHIESFWPRWLGNSAPELHGFFASADMGAAALFTLPKRWGEIYTTITNGPGYAAPENDRFKDFAARLTITPFANDSGLLRTFAITPWYYKGWLASAYTQATAAVSEGLQKDRRGIFMGLRDRKLTLGVELDQRLEELETTAPPVARGALNERTSQLFSAFALIRPAEWFDQGRRSRLGLVGRFDRFKVDTDRDPYTEFLVAGATWDLTSRITLALDYQGSTPRENPTGVPVKTWFFHYVATF
jgi:opacity protein-like surface antigen